MNVPELPLGEMIEKIPILAWSCRPDGTAEFLNQRWLDYTGLSPKEALGWGWQVAIHPEELGKVMDTWLGLLSSGEPGELEARLRRFDGEYRWFISRAAPVHDEQGKVVRWYGTSTDIDAQKRVEEELVKTERQLRILVENYPDFVARMDEEGRHLSVSPSVARVFGRPLEQILGKTIHELGIPGPPGQNDALLDAQLAGIKQVFEQGRPHTVEARWSSPSGERVFETRRIPEQDEQGRVVSVLCVTQEITERKRAEDVLHHAQMELAHVTRVATLGELTASIAHEINQPLGAIVNNAGACLRWLAAQNTEEARQSAALVIKDGHRASEIIDRIRALVMKAPSQKDWLDINETIREVTALAHFEMQRNGVTIETQLSDEVPLMLGDRIQLQQVLLNLMMNAIEAMSGAGEGPRELLVRSAKQESQNVLVAVQDSGPGLDPTRLDNLFDAFYTTKPRGLGMGLAISRSIIEAHGGRLWATANEGKGATFRFALPIDGERPA